MRLEGGQCHHSSLGRYHTTTPPHDNPTTRQPHHATTTPLGLMPAGDSEDAARFGSRFLTLGGGTGHISWKISGDCGVSAAGLLIPAPSLGCISLVPGQVVPVAPRPNSCIGQSTAHPPGRGIPVRCPVPLVPSSAGGVCDTAAQRQALITVFWFG